MIGRVRVFPVPRGSALRGLGLALAFTALTCACGWGGDASPSTGADNDPNVRFRGPTTYDFGVTNVRWEAATPEYSYVTFDLYWSYSWRAKWTEPAKTSATGKDMEVENWDAAWVFVKFLPEKDSDEAKERNHWLHATLDKDPANHVMPAGATNFVKLSDDGSRGMGVFIYRDAVGHGVNDWKGIKLRWNHPPTPAGAGSGAAGPPSASASKAAAEKSPAGAGSGAASGANFDPAKAAVKVHAIAMVYVPEGAFKVGSGKESGVYQKFADGPDMPAVHNMHNIRVRDQEMGGLTDGSWRGGPSIPCLIDAEWNAPGKEGTRARRIGNGPGELWGTHTYWEVNLGCVAVGAAGALPDDYPTGYEPFYCMKYELTQGQYVDFLNSLPPDVAAERAFVGREVSSDAGMHNATVKLDLGPDREPYVLVENGGCTIYSSADFSERANVSDLGAQGETGHRGVDSLMDDFGDGKAKGKGKGQGTKGEAATRQRPVYAARLPFRRLLGATPSDTFAYAVWAGLRPMSQLEAGKAANGARDPLAAPDWAAPENMDKPMIVADEGLPTERFVQGNSEFGHDFGLRVGCRSTPTSDRGTALATFWGISELGGPEIPVRDRGFRGTHGNGITSPGKPGAPVKRVGAKFKDAPPDWTEWWEYLGGHFVGKRCRLVVSADNRLRSETTPGQDRIQAPVGKATAQAAKPKPALPIPPMDGRKDDFPRVTNVKIEPGKTFSTVSFDLAWNNSWRATWTESAEKNCTGKPLPIENWDAAWVFVKFRPQGGTAFSHATLSPDAAHHAKPAGAALEMGLADDPSPTLPSTPPGAGAAGGRKGIGVFIYRDAVGQGANDFKGVKLRWLSGDDHVDPATVELSVHALAMVYVPEGPFRSKNPVMYYVDDSGSWSPDAYVCQLMTIDTPDASKSNGHANAASIYGKARKPYPHEGPDWPNGYSAFYCMKYSISQGEYARFLGEVGGGYSRALYGLGGDTILYSAGEGRFEAEVPDRPVKYLSDGDIYAFAAWAGLRPATCLEYEKACRGPRAVAREEDAWAPGACAPAAGLAQFVPSLGRRETPASSRLIWPSPSYWGIRDMSQSGAVIEWPAVVIEDGRGYVGNHGTGSPERPRDWPFYSRGEWYAYGMLQGFPLSQIGLWLLTEDYDAAPGLGVFASSRAGRYGARAVRTATRKANKDAPLQVEALPDLAGYDMAVVNLVGQYKNDGSQPLKVKLVAPLPADAYLLGATSLTFTATAKAVTPFRVPVALTRAVANVAERGSRALLLPVQVKGPGGELLAESVIRLPMDFMERPSSTIQSLDGGKIELKVKNATEKPLTLAFDLQPPPGVKLGQTKQSVTVAAGGDGKVVFPAPRQWFAEERSRACSIPYRMTVGSGAAVAGVVAAELQPQTRWWVNRKVSSGPKLSGGSEEMMKQAVPGIAMGGVFSEAGDVFTLAAPAKGWKPVTCGAGVNLGEAGPLPSRDSKAIGVTRVFAAGDVKAIPRVRTVSEAGETLSDSSKKAGTLFFVRVWVNDILAFDTRLPETNRSKPVQIRKGINTLLVEWQSNVIGAAAAQSVNVQFNDVQTGALVSDLFYDMEKR